MGTILNTAKDARSKIRKTNTEIQNSVIATGVETNRKKPIIVLEDKTKSARESAKEALVQINDVIGQLEKDSDRRSFYEQQKMVLSNFINDTQWVVDQND